ncbi:MAG: hypothetical protein AB7K41_00550 [Bdellovibrionales bacterium]
MIFGIQQRLWAMLLLVAVAIAAQQGCQAPWMLEADANSAASTSFTPEECPPDAAAISAESPLTIEDVVNLINRLPKPLSLHCFLSKLTRPLGLAATNARLSAQPAVDDRNPRIFILNGSLVLSVVPIGRDRNFLELSLIKGSESSVKAEILFPITGPISLSLPYERVRYLNGTTCSTCHSNEIKDYSISFTDAFISRAYKPKAESRISLDFLYREFQLCNARTQPERCSMLKGLFGYGPVRNQEFPTTLPTFF